MDRYSNLSFRSSRSSKSDTIKPTKPKKSILINIAETAKFYTSLCLGTIAFVSVFAFLFLIPFVVDPAITTLIANYESDPVTCVVTKHVYTEGISNCTWSSCREGCTKEVTKCHQLYVNYTIIPFLQYRRHPTAEWDVVNTHFTINPEGCGYPPSVNCTQFAKQYGYNTLGTPFPCFYSKAYPEMAVAHYSWESTLRHLVLSLAVPNLLFISSVGMLSYWYCPGCSKTCKRKRHTYPSK